MSEYDNEGKGVLFQQEQKRHDRSPDHWGNITIGGKEWRLSGWKYTSRSGKPYISLSVSDPDEYEQKKGQRSGGGGRSPQQEPVNRHDDGPAPGPPIDVDPDIPF